MNEGSAHKAHPRGAVYRSCLLWCACFALGCGGQSSQRKAKPSQILDMEPILLEYDENAGDGKQIKAYDAQGLFVKGKTAFESGQFQVCVDAYGALIQRFPDSRYAHSSLYNRGLCLESLKMHSLAAEHFRRHAQMAKSLSDRRDGEFRLGFNLVKMGDFPSAVDLYDELLKAEDLTALDRAECRLRRAMAYAGLNRPGDADTDLARVAKHVNKATGGLSEGNALLAEANFRRGEIYQDLAHGVPLALPMESMEKDLAEKVRFFRQSQRGYLAALNVRNHYWGTAAGLKLGELYEQFYDDVLGAEVPDDFDEKTRKFYVLELRKQLQPLLEHSLSIYEKNMSMSARLGEENEWVEETERRLEKLRGLIAENHSIDPASVLEDDETSPKKAKPNKGSPDKGSPDKGSPDKGSPDKGSADKGSADKGSADKGGADKGSADKGSADKGSADKGSADKGSADKGSADKGSAKKGSADKGSAKKGSAKKGSAKKGSAKKGSAKKGSAKKGSAKKGSAKKGSAKKGSSTTEGSSDPSSKKDK